MATAGGTVDENGILWKSTQPGAFTDSFGSASNLYETLVASAKANGSSPAAGQRPVTATHMVKGFEKYELGVYDFMTYTDYFTAVESLGSGMTAAIPGMTKGDTVVIYAETQRAWMLAAYAAWRQGLVVGTIYATLGEEGALFGINQSKCKAVVADSKLLKILVKIADKFTHLKDIISITEPPAEAAEKLTAAGITIHKMDELTANGAAAKTEPTPSAPDDTAVLMYTSGTTGNPKGVLISHKAILSIVGATCSPNSAVAVNGKSYLTPKTVYLAYLPLAHIMELAVEVTCFSVGAKIGYGNPGTLTPNSLKMMTDPPQIGDAAMLAPTVFVAAPAVLDKVLIAIKAKFAATSNLVQGFVASGLASGAAKFDRGGMGTNHLIAKIIFRKAQKLLGGCVELMLTGSAPLAPEVQKFVQTVFACRVRQGYGLTETCAATCITLADDNSVSSVGPPQESACIRLRDWEEGGYKNADKDNKEIGMRRGEILIGGPTIAQGYLVDKDDPDPDIVAKNNDDFVTIDGIRYFCTGDIGQFTAAGNLMVIDRKKDLVKLQMGEYVALSKVENALKASTFTALPMVYATSSMSYAIALICPNPGPLKAKAAELGVEGELPALCKDEKVIAAVLEDCAKVCKAAKLQKFETPTKIILIDELWTPENDMLTAVQKLKRREIAAKHKAQIDETYV